MTEVVSFIGYTPPARFDATPWTNAQIEEAATITGTFATIDTVTLGTPDVDPSQPAARSFTTSLGTAVDLWYRVVFVDGVGNVSEPTTAVQNGGAEQAYASVTELARILKIRTPSDAQVAAMERVLVTTADEINDEIDLADDTTLTGAKLALVTQVNLDRAADLWNHTESQTGLTAILGDEGGIPTPGRYSWNRYALRLASVKDRWGLA